MVDLPKVPRRLTLTEAPRAGISAETAAGPFAQASRALGVLGEGVEAAGVRIAEDEGLRAVQTGPDGKPEFAPQPAFTGKAGEAYNRVGYARYMAELQNASERDVLDARGKFRGDPAGFDEWSKTYVSDLVAKAPDERLRAAVKTQLDNTVTQTFRAITTEKQNLDIAATKNVLLTRGDLLENRMAALARQGGIDTPEYRGLQQDHLAIEKELTKNPLFAYPQEVADAARAKMTARHTVEAAIGSMDGIFNKKGRDAARKFLEGVAWDPSLNLDEKERTTLVQRGLARLEGLTAEDAARLTGFRDEVTQHVQNFKKGVEIDPRSYEELLNRARGLGDAQSEFKLRAAYLENNMLRQYRTLPDSAKPQFLRDLNAGLNLAPSQRDIKGKIEAEAIAQGLDPKAAVMIAFRESKLDATAIPKVKLPDGTYAPASTARGVFQLDQTQRQKYGLADDADADAQIKAGITSLKARFADMTTRLGREPTASELYLAHFQGAQGAETLLKAGKDADLKGTLDSVLPSWRGKKGETWGEAVLSANPWMKAYPTVGGFLDRINQMTGEATTRASADLPNNPYVSGARADLSGVITQDMSQGVERMVTSFIDATKKRNAVNEDELKSLVDWIQITGRFDEGRKLADHLAAFEGGRLISALPPQRRDALLADLKRKAETVGETPQEKLYREMAENQVKSATEQMAKNPHQEAPRQGLVQNAPAYLDVADPAAVEKALPQRVATAQAIRQYNPANGPVSALDEAEIDRLGPVLVNGDAGKAASILGALQRGTNAEMFAQTVSQPAFKTALEGMIKTGDTTRMGAAFSALDRAWQQNPAQFEATFGASTYKQLAAWQSHMSYMSQEQVADLFRKRNDPATAKARGDVVTQMRAEANKLSDSEIFNEFGTSVLGLTFGAARANANPIQAAVFRSEFADLYSELRADGVDHENALKRSVAWVGRVWGTSATNDNRLMRRPPESWAPQVNGSHAWLKSEVEGEITRVLGPQYPAAAAGIKLMQEGGSVNPLLKAVTPIANWQYSLVADPQTEGEIAKLNQWKAANPGKTPPPEMFPSYQLFVFDKDKRQIDLLADTFQKTMEQGPFNVATALRAPTAQARFRWTGAAIVDSAEGNDALRRYYLQHEEYRSRGNKMKPVLGQ